MQTLHDGYGSNTSLCKLCTMDTAATLHNANFAQWIRQQHFNMKTLKEKRMHTEKLLLIPIIKIFPVKMTRNVTFYPQKWSELCVLGLTILQGFYFVTIQPNSRTPKSSIFISLLFTVADLLYISTLDCMLSARLSPPTTIRILSPPHCTGTKLVTRLGWYC